VTITGDRGAELERLASQRGLKMEAKGDEISMVISVATPEEALAQLGVLSGLLAQKP
jgi:hypothetical protein